MTYLCSGDLLHLQCVVQKRCGRKVFFGILLQNDDSHVRVVDLKRIKIWGLLRILINILICYFTHLKKHSVVRALARIYKLPVILKRVPVKKKLMLLERHKSSASHHRWGPGARLRASDGVQGAAPLGSCGVLAILNALGEPSWTSISNLLICIFMFKKDTNYGENYENSNEYLYVLYLTYFK